MTTGTQTLTDWLLSCIAEDEAVARRWIPNHLDAWRERWEAHGYEYDAAKIYDDVYSIDLSGTYQSGPYAGQEMAYGVGKDCRIPQDVGDHITRWDPARVLAECEAKRHVIEMYQSFAEQAARNENPTLQLMDSARLALMDIIIRALALPFADRPGFRSEWA